MSLKYALLGMLTEGPKYGYEIKQNFESILDNVWSVSYGQLYPTLHRLSALGWVTKKTAPGKKAGDKNVYSITAAGKQELDDWLLKPLRTTYNVKDEFTLKFLFFNKLEKGSVLRYLREQQHRIDEQCQKYEDTLSSMQNEQDFFLKAIVRKGIVHLQAEHTWLQEIISKMHAGP